MEFKDYYKILGVPSDASQDDIKRSYRKLARKYHPDVSKEADAEAHFKEVGEAYEVLKDPEKRAAYDKLGRQWKSGEDFRPPPDWNQGFEFHTHGFESAGPESFSDFFQSLFGQGGFGRSGSRSQGPRYRARGEDSYARIAIDLEDAYHGAVHQFTLQHTELSPDGHPQLATRALKVRIPKGVREGQYIRLAKQGSAGIAGGEPGDLYLEVHFRSHPMYVLDGRDVYLDLPVAPWEAALGATIKVPTPLGAIDLKIPKGSSGGQKLRIKGRGIPGRPAGDFYVSLKIALPPADSDAMRDAYRKLAQAQEFNPRKHLGV